MKVHSLEILTGYFTIGDILPVGLSEQTWIDTFARHHTEHNSREDLGAYIASGPKEYGGGYDFDTALFVYGQPDREFDNRWDLVDPADLVWATEAEIIYHSDTGELVMDTTGPNGGYISMFFLESEGEFLSDNFTPWLSSHFASQNPHAIGFAADAIEPGVYSLGMVLPSGLTEEELNATITNTSFLGRAGFRGASFSLGTDSPNFSLAMATANVPEPASIIFVAMSAAALALAPRQAR